MKSSIFVFATFFSVIKASPTPPGLIKRAGADSLSSYTAVFTEGDKSITAPGLQGGRSISQPYNGVTSPAECAAKCDATTNCVCFNIYEELLGGTSGTARCDLYRICPQAQDATNSGSQSRLAGPGLTTKAHSALYARTSLVNGVDVDGYTYTCYPNAYIEGPTLDFRNTGADLSGCSSWCDYYNDQVTSCPFFNFWNVYKNGIYDHSACRIYQVTHTAADATNTGYTDATGTWSYFSCGYTRNP
ncbi:hypothetical protein ABW21_db0201340 [Orbilia brochopaga]|nr:hypothetical protein ABW21_db0201340 [Drechslerella brochopaga]